MRWFINIHQYTLSSLHLSDQKRKESVTIRKEREKEKKILC